jgi:hypothetical protein
MIKKMDDGYIMVNTGNRILFPAGLPARRRRVRGTQICVSQRLHVQSLLNASCPYPIHQGDGNKIYSCDTIHTWGNRPFRAISGGHRLQSPVQQGSPVLQHFLEIRIHQPFDK